MFYHVAPRDDATTSQFSEKEAVSYNFALD